MEPRETPIVALNWSALSAELLAFKANPAGYISKNYEKHGPVTLFHLPKGKTVHFLAGWEALQQFYDSSKVSRKEFGDKKPEYYQCVWAYKHQGTEGLALPVLDGAPHIEQKKHFLTLFTEENVGEFFFAKANEALAHGVLDMTNKPEPFSPYAVGQRLVIGILASIMYTTELPDEIYDAIQTNFHVFSPSLWEEVTGSAAEKASVAQKKLYHWILERIGEHQRATPGTYDDGLSRFLENVPASMNVAAQLTDLHHVFMGGLGAATAPGAALYILNQHPLVFDRLQEEVRNVTLNSIDDLNKLTYVEQVAKEIVRFFPSPSVPGVAIDDIRFAWTAPDGEQRLYTVPKGSTLIACPYATVHDSRFYEPGFDPDRFFENSTGMKTHAGLPEGALDFAQWSTAFGGGKSDTTHRCGGYNMALLIIKLSVFYLAKHRVFQYCDEPSVDMGPVPYVIKNDLVEKVKPKSFLYQFQVKTGSRGGFRGQVQVTLKGQNNVPFVLHDGSLWGTPFVAKSKLSFFVEGPEVRDAWGIQVAVSKTTTASYIPTGMDWFLETIVVLTPDGVKYFPCFSWIPTEGENVVFFEGSASTHPGPSERLARQLELERKRGGYPWLVVDQLPGAIDGHYDSLPRNEKWEPGAFTDFKYSAKVAKAHFVFEAAEKFIKTDHWDEIKDFRTIFDRVTRGLLGKTDRILYPPPLSLDPDAWKDDYLWGLERLQGASHAVFQLLKTLPSDMGFPCEAAVRQFLRPGRTFEEELADARFYYLDYRTELQGLELKPERYAAYPICLLYLDTEDRMRIRPIAIQLWPKEKPIEPWNPIWLPSDKTGWLLAKLFCTQADVHLHQLRYHLLECHLAMEPINVSVNRNLSDRHPIYKLLKPHMTFHLGINALARDNLIAPTGVIAQISSFEYATGFIRLGMNSWRNYNFAQASYPNRVAARGVGDPEKLPLYSYNQDGKAIWDSVHKLCRSVVELFYPNDEAVEHDSELADFAREIFDIGYQSNPDKGFPKQFKTKAELIEACATIIFTVSAQHASLNFGQYDSMGYVLMSPAGLFQPPPGYNRNPVDKSTFITKEEDLVKYLPNKGLTIKQIAITWVLSQYSETFPHLGSYPDLLWSDPTVLGYLRTFEAEMEGLSATISARGGWTRMNPKNVPTSVAI